MKDVLISAYDQIIMKWLQLARRDIMPRRPKRNCRENPMEKGIHAFDLKESVINGLKQFLGGKLGHDGNPIPKEELYSENSCKTVLRTPFDDETFNFIHDECLTLIPAKDWYKETTVPWTVHYLLGLLNELKSLQIPKEFQPGFLLLYFKFCKGFTIPPPPLL
jgi:hypothetical protein